MAEPDQNGESKRKKRRRKPRPGDPVRMPAWLKYPLSIGTLGAAFLFFRRGDPVTATTVIVIAFSGWTGFKMGFGRITASVLALIAAVAFAPLIGMGYETQFSQHVGTTGLTNRFLCIAAIGVMISLVVTIPLTMLSNHLLFKRRRLNLANSLVGFAIGIAEGVVMAFLVLGGLLSLQMWQRADARQDHETLADNRIAVVIDEWASRTRQSAIGPTIRDYNPFERFEMLASVREMRDDVRRLKNPDNIRRLLDNPKLAALRSDPAVSAAIDEIRNDQTIKELVDQRRPLDRQAITQLMSNPSVMRLVDQPGFIEMAREAIAELK